MFEQTEEKLSRSEERYIKSLLRKNRRQSLGALATLLCATSAIGIYNYDADINEALSNQDKIYLKTIEDNGNDTSIIFADGFNTINANYLSRNLGPVLQNIHSGANIQSITTGDSTPDPVITAELIHEHMDENGVSSLSLFGYSIGGVATIKIAAELLEKDPYANIDTIYLASTPDSVDSILPEKRQLIDGLITALSHIPRSEHSTFVKFLVTLGFHKEDFMPGATLIDSVANFDAEEFAHQWDDAYRVTTERKRPSLATLEQQLELARTDLSHDIQRIADAAYPSRMPQIVYLKIANPGYDDIVNNTHSAENICTAAASAGLQCTVIDVQGGRHAEYYTPESVKAYTEAILANQELLQTNRPYPLLKLSEESYQASEESTTPIYP